MDENYGSCCFAANPPVPSLFSLSSILKQERRQLTWHTIWQWRIRIYRSIVLPKGDLRHCLVDWESTAASLLHPCFMKNFCHCNWIQCIISVFTVRLWRQGTRTSYESPSPRRISLEWTEESFWFSFLRNHYSTRPTEIRPRPISCWQNKTLRKPAIVAWSHARPPDSFWLEDAAQRSAGKGRWTAHWFILRKEPIIAFRKFLMSILYKIITGISA